MDPLKLQIVKYDGKAITIDLAEEESVNHVLHALADNGYLILKKATRPISSGGPLTEDVLWNKVRVVHGLKTIAKTLLSSSRQFFSHLRMATSRSQGMSSTKSIMETKR